MGEDRPGEIPEGPSGDRLQKVLAAHGVASRRGAEELIASGVVTVNGHVAQLGERVNLETDHIAVRGVPLVTRLAALHIALNKPAGYVTSLASTHGEQTVMELVDAGRRVFPVGRLDRETSGLLLLTDDGDWANLVTHPRYEIDKEYRVRVRGRLSRASAEQLERGVQLPDGTMTAPARVRIVSAREEMSELTVEVIEGKKRQIRLMCAALGHPVLLLRRVRIGPIELGSLPEGSWRRLRSEEVDAVRHYHRNWKGKGEREVEPTNRNRRPGRVR